MLRFNRSAQWHLHVNSVNPTPLMRDWLTDRTSLTLKLTQRSQHFRVQCLRQAKALSLSDEYSCVGLTQRRYVYEREVLLFCDDCPMVYAHTIVPLSATVADWPFFSTLGNRSLGTTLFGDPLVRRGALHYARLKSHHPLAQRVSHAVDTAAFKNSWSYLLARRCLFQRKAGQLLVTEIFLPDIVSLTKPRHATISQSI